MRYHTESDYLLFKLKHDWKHTTNNWYRTIPTNNYRKDPSNRLRQYLLFYVVSLLIAIRLIGKLVNTVKRAIREPIEETDEQYLKRVKAAEERNKKIREENTYISNQKKDGK